MPEYEVSMKAFPKFFLFGSALISLGASASVSMEWEGEPLDQLTVKNRPVVRSNAPVRLLSATIDEPSFLGYDSGPAVFFPQAAVAGSIWAIRFSPLQSCSLTAFSVYSAGGEGSVRVHIFSDSAGLPSRDLTSPFTAELAGNLTNQVIYLPVPVGVGNIDFHLAFELLAGGAPYITGDDDGGSGHSGYFAPGAGWSGMSGTDYAARAQVRYYGPDEIPPLLRHTPPDAVFAEEGLEISARISDFSGISEATVKYSVNGGAWAVIRMQACGENFKTKLPSPAAGSTVRYFIEARDDAELPNVSLAPATGLQAPFELPVFTGWQIKYDDGSAEDFFVAGYHFDDNRFAVRLTPEIYPAQVHTLRAFVNDTAKFFFLVCSDSNGVPGRPLSGPWKAGVQEGEKGWVNLELPVGSRPLVESGSFFLVVQWSPASPAQPGIGADGALPDGRSLFYTGAGGWKSWVYNDWMVRASYTVSKAGQNLPLRFSLEQNFPNPFNPSTEIRFRLEQPSEIELSVYNILGQKIKTLAFGSFPGGEHSVVWDGRDERGGSLSSGVYFYRLRAEAWVLTRRMVLIK